MRRLAIDGGGTSAKVLIADGNTIVFELQGGPCNWSTSSREGWIETIRAAIGGRNIDAAYGCFAGVLTADESDCQAALAEAASVPTERCRAESDCAGALASFPATVTIGVIAGTGSSVFGRVEGRLIRSGGGGPFLGDPGSAVDIMRRWLNQEVVTATSRPSNPLDDELTRRAGAADRDSVLRWLARSPSPAQELAELFPTLAATDPEHSAIRESFRALATQVVAHAQIHSPAGPFVVGLTGGVWKAHASFKPMFQDALRQAGAPESATIEVPSMTPVEGVLRLAKATFS